jgi:hypothetical protein
MAKFSPRKAKATRKSRAKKSTRKGGAGGRKGNAWRSYVGGRSNEPIPF